MKRIILLFALYYHAANGQIIADFSADTSSGCAPLTVNFTDMSTGGVVAWFWDFGDGSGSTVQNPSHLFVSPGTFNVKLKTCNSADTVNGTCNEVQKNGYININSKPAISFNKTDVSCNGVDNGSATVNISGGNPPYQLPIWNDAFVGITHTNLSAGNYTVSVTDSIGCTSQSSVTILEPAALVVNQNVVPESCNGCCDGDISVSVSGGTSPYMYQWNNGAICQSTECTNGCSGIYDLTVTDANGCTNNSTIAITVCTINISLTITSVSCFGSFDGSICAAISGGSSPYSFQWSNGSTATCMNGSAGQYSVTVTDVNGCTNTATTAINQPSALVADAGPDQTSCGSIALGGSPTASGGSPPYEYLWWDTAAFADPYVANPTLLQGNSGIFIVNVQDGNGCSDTASVIITSGNALSVSLSVTNTSCGVCNGSASANVSGGTGSFTFLWSNGQISSTATGLCAGNHFITVSDSIGCTWDSVISINNSSGFSATAISTNVLCNGGNSGTASAIPQGGIPPYTYLWNNYILDSTTTGLGAGTYSCTVSDATGCEFVATASVSQPPALALNFNVENIGCGNTSGSITANASGGVGNYQFSIDSGSTFSSNSVFSNLDSGSYLIIVNDSNNCQFSQSAIIISTGASPVTLNGNVINSSACGNWGNGSISLSATGGSAPYIFNWINPVMNSGNNKHYLLPGSYTAMVMDNNSCTDTAIFTLSNTCPNAFITGFVFQDSNANCIKDPGELALSNWQVKATGSNTYYGTVNSNGFYEIWATAGNYTVQVVKKPMWDISCPVSPGLYYVSVAAQDTASNINFGLQPDSGSCPYLFVSLSHIGYSPCFCNWYLIQYNNYGPVAATNAYVELTLPSGVVPVDSCSMPFTYWNHSPFNSTWYTSQSGNTYTYNIGTIPPNVVGSFYVLVQQSCSLTLNSTLCTEVHIYPDTSCTPPNTSWDKSSVKVTGECLNDSACFVIKNKGSGDMQGTSEYRIYENNILVFTGTFQINSGDSINICRPANSNTIRLEADQRPYHPGNSHPQASVEMCGQPVFTLGQITLVPEDDADDFIDIVCTKVTSSWDPNDKQVQPEGLTDQFHFIDSTAQLEYHIRFQNTGNDTAWNIFIYDTLSPFVNVETFEAGAASHPYTYEIAGEGIVRFIFQQIMLVDSNKNEPASHGFLKYLIKQKGGNPKGTKIENTAGIVFDFNEPVITNTVFNTIGNIDSLTGVGISLINEKHISINIYPNPFSAETTFEISGIKNGTYRLEIFDLLGKSVNRKENINTGKFNFDRRGLNNGIYFYIIHSENNILGKGKMVVY